MIKIFKQLLDFIYKKKCYLCHSAKENKIVCDKCFEKLDYSSYQKNNLKVNNNFYDLYFAGFYTKELQKLIRGLKYHNEVEIADILAIYMFEYFKFLNIYNEKVLILPVPMYKKKRKYNHVELIAQKFASLTNNLMNSDILIRAQDTKPLYNLSKVEREKTIENAFILNLNNYNGEKILLMDDIITTGTTIKEIIKVLNSSNIYDITIFTTSASTYWLN